MKCLQFTVPVPEDKSVVAERELLPYHYPYLHRHNEVQLTWIQKGEGTLIAGNNMHPYAPGDIFLIGANLPHVFKSNPEYYVQDSGKYIQALTIFFNPEGILAPLFSLPEMLPSLYFFQQHQHGFKLPESAFNSISSVMDALEKATGTDQLMQFFQLVKGLTTITGKQESLSSFCALPGITESEGIRIGNIYNYIMQHYSEEISLEDVAIAYMTPESFCRYFKKHTGHTFVSFLNEVRINEACKKLLSQKYESLHAIAYNCGFKSLTNFNRVFKFVVGNSPRAYLDHYTTNVIN